MDGWVKAWHFGRFKVSNVDDLKVVIKPVFKLEVTDSWGPSTLSYCLKRSTDPNETEWMAQVLLLFSLQMEGGLTLPFKKQERENVRGRKYIFITSLILGCQN